MSTFVTFAWALFGGAFFELLHWVGLKKSKYFPVYAGSNKYWVITVLMVISGALLAVSVSLSGTTLTPLTAILIGYSAPSLIQRLAKSVPIPRLGSGDGKEVPPSVYGFLIG